MFRKLDELRDVPLNHGKAREFLVPYDRVVTAAKQAIIDTGLTIKETQADSATQTTFLAERGITALSWGELVRVIVQRSSSSSTTVRVVTMRRFALNLTAKGDFSKAIFANMQKTLGQD